MIGNIALLIGGLPVLWRDHRGEFSNKRMEPVFFLGMAYHRDYPEEAD